ncbi:uncharacterized protein RHOBADRAFT_56156 [Rhodotorula graminis WP1]|uniref:ubiquitinyl hydrolase 1 n=1 Tax=Rhodotorula graminis (strain WP1) TaxID=578459 RepID=A0A0P9F8P1_RHOGW|nr:uncharacterized protein RHOBADRAFT_56156 [Rhodotorula graminis WP1]KPV72020.1 hypothetical protein RHOBADRAFT_56156 [Rhodotorula graminis WP1]
MSTKPLSELSDLEISSLTQELKESEASKRPLVGPLEPLDHLAQEFPPDSLYRNKVSRLQSDGWSGIRRARGDGDCFYRSFIFALLEAYLPLHPSHAAHLLTKVESLLPLLTACGFDESVWEDFHEPLRRLLHRMGPEEKDGGKRKDGEPKLTRDGLVEAFNDPETNSCIIVILRLITSAYLRTHEDEFAPFLFALDDDPRFLADGGAPTMRQFCADQVEAVAREADHLAIAALTRALQVPLRIAYLDQSLLGAQQLAPGGEGASSAEAEVNFFEFEDEAARRGEKGIEGGLLYRPGHYDILYR